MMNSGGDMAVVSVDIAPHVPVRSAFIRASTLVSFLIPTLLVTDYTLAHFYVRGAYYTDSGWYSYLATHLSGWPLANPPALGGTYFSYHISPIFFLPSLLYSLLFPGMPAAAFFSLFHGVQFGLIGLALALMFRDV